MPPTKKKTTARAKAPEGFAPIQLSSKATVEGERILLFAIDDVEYTVPKKIPRSLSLRIMRTARLQGELAASQELMEVVMGEDAYVALMNCDSVTDEQLDQISQFIQDLALGGVEGKA
ncbi:hypothetical protein [Streptomyces sp. NPDC056291]|uniref:hypothetical protein n=1 Tax=Streptomyces sp. NPDC056291 TaxID=3345772 RepID=UPI0035D54983